MELGVSDSANALNERNVGIHMSADLPPSEGLPL